MVLIGLERQDILGFNIGCTIGQDILYFTICGLIATLYQMCGLYVLALELFGRGGKTPLYASKS
jgi:hypothetical protein